MQLLTTRARLQLNDRDSWNLSGLIASHTCQPHTHISCFIRCFNKIICMDEGVVGPTTPFHFLKDRWSMG
jgi:hypothetical protein